MLKIALVGRKASGKTFAAFYLKRQYGFKQVRMDDGVAKAMRILYSFKKNERPTWQRKMDIYDVIYKLDPNTHIDYMLRRLERTTNDIVIEDVRYVNELQVLKAQGFIIVRIAAPETRRRRIGSSTRKSGAGTLVLQEYFNQDKTQGYSADYSIYNDTREGTRRSLDTFIDTLRNSVI